MRKDRRRQQVFLRVFEAPTAATLCLQQRLFSCSKATTFLPEAVFMGFFVNCGGRFVSPVVSPGGVKMGTLLITQDDRNNYLTGSKASVCTLLMTSANS